MPKSRNFNVANMTFNAIREIKILATISEFIVYELRMFCQGYVDVQARLSNAAFQCENMLAHFNYGLQRCMGINYNNYAICALLSISSTYISLV